MKALSFWLCNSSSDLTWQCHALYLVRLTGVSLQFTFRHRVGLSQVEKGEPVPHGRLLSLCRRSLATATQKQIIFNTRLFIQQIYNYITYLHEQKHLQLKSYSLAVHSKKCLLQLLRVQSIKLLIWSDQLSKIQRYSISRRFNRKKQQIFTFTEMELGNVCFFRLINYFND